MPTYLYYSNPKKDRISKILQMMMLSPILSRCFPYTFQMFFLHIFQHYPTFLGLLPRSLLQVPLFSVLNAFAAVLGAIFLGAAWPGACVCGAQSAGIHQEIWGFEPWLINQGYHYHVALILSYHYHIGLSLPLSLPLGLIRVIITIIIIIISHIALLCLYHVLNGGHHSINGVPPNTVVVICYLTGTPPNFESLAV